MLYWSLDSLSKKLNRMMFLAAIFGIAAVVIGYVLAIWLNVNITGAMVSVSGIIFMMVLIIDKIFRKQQVSKSLNPA